MSKTRCVKMYVGRIAPKDWYAIDVVIPADTPQEQVAIVACRVLKRILDKGDVRAAFCGVYPIPDEHSGSPQQTAGEYGP